MRAVFLTGITWLLLTILMRWILPEGEVQLALGLVVGTMFIIVPIVNHVGIFIAIRRQNKQVQNAVSGQNASSVIFRREKIVAIDMLIVTAVLLLCLAPGIAVSMFKGYFRDEFGILYAWSSSVVFINSSINPFIYVIRRRDINNVIQSMLFF